MAIAANVRPAIASGPRSRQRQPENDWNSGQSFGGAAAGKAFIASSALQAQRPYGSAFRTIAAPPSMRTNDFAVCPR
jgi:hypothetical protein